MRVTTIASLAEAAGVHCAIGSNLEWDIGSAAMAHVCAAIPNICVERYAADIIGPIFHTEQLIKTSLIGESGYVRVPQGEGLGVKLVRNPAESDNR